MDTFVASSYNSANWYKEIKETKMTNEKISLKIRKSERPGRGNVWIIDVNPYEGPGDLHYSYVTADGTRGDYEDYPSKEKAEVAAALFRAKQLQQNATSAEIIKIEHEENEGIRIFDTGATRDTTKGKLSYVKALSPIVLQRYVQYLDGHRKQPDGSMRDFDNWKKGIPEDTYLDGLGRHFIAAWLLAQGYSAEDNHGPVTLENTLCAILFGASGWLHEILKKKIKDVD